MIRRVRVLKSIAARFKFYPAGAVLSVPETISELQAKEWLRAGLVEEDKMLDGPPEIKVPNAEVKAPEPVEAHEGWGKHRRKRRK